MNVYTTGAGGGWMSKRFGANVGKGMISMQYAVYFLQGWLFAC